MQAIVDAYGKDLQECIETDAVKTKCWHPNRLTTKDKAAKGIPDLDPEKYYDPSVPHLEVQGLRSALYGEKREEASGLRSADTGLKEASGLSLASASWDASVGACMLSQSRCLKHGEVQQRGEGEKNVRFVRCVSGITAVLTNALSSGKPHILAHPTTNPENATEDARPPGWMRGVLRNALLLSELTGRALILPHLTCWCERHWWLLEDCRVAAGNHQMPMPYECPMDHLFEPAAWFYFKVLHFSSQHVSPCDAGQRVTLLFTARESL
ncbi:hypothetical protein CYMTET_27507 [Cymbomonas tetramitiformis]|uniref:Uncharacterized protein n=1 Tax=Cymbomonas tetramitiformis TaxID=36881 RepID=A0AAE0FRA4_9CHLO|nr:hypothetical protein CYMTET_27507 [Cymbomonas tetramitiformis]